MWLRVVCSLLCSWCSVSSFWFGVCMVGYSRVISVLVLVLMLMLCWVLLISFYSMCFIGLSISECSRCSGMLFWILLLVWLWVSRFISGVV